MATPREPTDIFPTPLYGPGANAAPLAVPQPAIADLTAAPTEADFNSLLAKLRAAGIIAAS